MELSWPMKMRITAVAALGVILIGILAWPIASPADPLGAVLAGNITFSGRILLVVLALMAGLISYFLAWPCGREIGILAVPAGLAVWAVRTGNVSSIMLANQTAAQRQKIYATLAFESIFWLALVAAGFIGVIMAAKILAKAKDNNEQTQPGSKSNIYLNPIIALVGSVFIAQFCIAILAQGVRWPDGKLTSVMAQPSVGQIVFAVTVAFAVAGFAVKKFLDLSYIWPTIASAIVTSFAVIIYAKKDALDHLVVNWPPVYFPNPVLSILPIQIVTFGTLGSVIGYWWAVRFNYWRKHEI